ncbi:hypothetical protein ACFQPA_18550 [Halomarina halobia]|uniref:Uncharacterized protein n=1 Tax=Halomarina halobia TaxID=3033386 RepID=A0ABD6ADV4_9EURY|nr:hypothetical protein [Halomarina sp. PSR21]
MVLNGGKNRQTATECVACGLGAGFNRAVLDVVTGDLLGGLCVGCEERNFGKSLVRGDWSLVEGCAFCARDGFYALPLWRPYTENRGGDTVCRVALSVDGATLRLCDEHLTAIAGESARTDDGDRRPNRVE